ncbi:FMN-dependent NADH-azoreductase [Parasphingopyxis lamellibrachiae]|uniref:FMN dependent NADH:quinone oxidoreductase n=1 Tax=Parasphingopyxis lamellibrachiae TaxID=680125 RepID=A0A3D9FHE6_9SPHN|nr:NAD(P)H-dependent oxidoreductase [Parasphingopyxis lamellibrachiae]RED16511.1 FMN-dependent NADH-azoreductase [Parasphingopyxis lamellibrachiae]
MSITHAPTLLRIDSSGRSAGSNSRALTDHLIAKLAAENPDAAIVARDVAQGLPFVSDDWINANFTAAEERDDSQAKALTLSDTLVAELEAAKIIVIGTPIYNFGIPASLKAWIDMVARAGKTFKYTDTGPVGLLEGKKAYVAIASGGTEVGSTIDFASGYLKHVLGFLGIHDVAFFAADQLMMHGDEKVAATKTAIDAVV